jgi:hypothetical protein
MILVGGKQIAEVEAIFVPSVTPHACSM